MHEPTGMLGVSLDRGGMPAVKLSGEADFHNRSQIQEALDSLLARGENRILVDLSDLHYMDSSALSTLARCASAAMDAGGCVELASPNHQVHRALTLSGALGFFGVRVGEAPLTHDEVSHRHCSDRWHVSQFSLPAVPESASAARARVADAARSVRFTEAEIQDLCFAVGEAMSNAIRHGCRYDPAVRVGVRCVAGSEQVTVDITDPGLGFDPQAVPPPSFASLPEGGMGIFVMRQLMDEVSFTFGQGTTVTLTKRTAAWVDAPAQEMSEHAAAAG